MSDNHVTPILRLHTNVDGLEPSATLAINERSDALRRAGRRIYKLGLGQSPFPVPASVVETLQRHAFEKDYLPVRGLEELRRAVAEHHAHVYGIDCSVEDILVAPGSKELMFLLQMASGSDLVLPTPAWVSYAPQARIAGRRLVFLHTRREDDWRLGAAALDELCRADPGRARILLLNYPSNPTGTTYSAAQLEELAAVARRHRLIVLADEIYGKLHHHGEHVSIARYYPEGTIWSGGLSKWCGAGGWRLGIFVFPSQLRLLLETMAAVASETYTSTNAPIQYAAVRAFAGGPEIDRYLADSRRLLRALAHRLTNDLRAAGALVTSPEGGFYLLPDLGPLVPKLAARGIATSSELCEHLLEDTGVAVLPGSDFGRPPEELTIRLAYINFDGGRVLEALDGTPPEQELDDAFLRKYCADTLEGVARLCEWLS